LITDTAQRSRLSREKPVLCQPDLFFTVELTFVCLA
jgi:hypothetical protein